jgi:hypothetical protein
VAVKKLVKREGKGITVAVGVGGREERKKGEEEEEGEKVGWWSVFGEGGN